MDVTTGFYDYCVCFIEQPSNRSLAERFILEVSAYKLPKKAKHFDEEPAYKRGCLIALTSDTPLTKEHKTLLSSCRWLMVLCNKQAHDAVSIRQIIDYFILNKGRAFILPILLEGEPQNAFPPEFFEERTTTVTFHDGLVQTFQEIIEPLAIDVRARDIKTSLSLIRQIRIKVVAALIGVSYDTLEQRHEKRARQRLRFLSATILTIPLIFGTLFTYLWLNSEYQIDMATKKSQISKDLLVKMCQDYPSLFEDIPEAKPLVNALLLDSLEKLRIADSSYMPLLPIDNFLLPEETDDLEQARSKAKILRYLEKKEAAIKAYEQVALRMDQGADEYIAISSLFTNKVPASLYSCGIWVRLIDKEASKDCDGLKKGDIIVASKGFRFRSLEQFQNYVFSYLPSNQITKMIILRPKGDCLEEITLEMKPEDLKFESEEL